MTTKDEAFVSVILPCLNEVKTIALVIDEIHHAFRASAYDYEILVADNGSTDGSSAAAQAAGAQVIPVAERGYGAALQGGIREARGSLLLFGDADGTYEFARGPEMIDRLLQGPVGMVIGSRLNSTLERGAMPLLHRYLGTPVLSRLINSLLKAHITDCNSGLRAFRRERYAVWSPTTQGMEFASEMIVNCLKSGDTIEEIPISLRRDRRDRPPHLSTWRDGMRHLLVILSRAPHGFTCTGLVLLGLSLAAALPSIIVGPIRWGPVAIFDTHSLVLAILIGFLGTQFISYGLLLDARSTRPMSFNSALLAIQEVTLLRIMLCLAMLIIGFVLFLIVVWWRHGFNNLSYIRASLSFLYGTVVIGNIGLGLFLSQLHRKM